MPLIFENLTRAALENLPRERTLILLPIGVLEDHGPHLPLGLDLQEATHLAYRIATKLEALPGQPPWTCVIFPPAPLGCDSNTDLLRARTKGTVLRDYLYGIATSLHERGFRHFAAVSGSLAPKQLTAIEEAGRAFTRWHNGLFLLKMRAPQRLVTFSSLSSALVTWEDVKSSPLLADPQEHGSRRDISVGLALAPEHPVARPPLLAGPEGRLARWVLRLRGKREGYWGSDPAGASAAEGEALLEKNAEVLMGKLRHVIEGGENPDKIFRSGYGYFLPNYSTFPALGWTLLGTVILLMWVSWTVQLLMFR